MSSKSIISGNTKSISIKQLKVIQVKEWKSLPKKFVLIWSYNSTKAGIAGSWSFEVYGDNVVMTRVAQEWFKRFCSGDFDPKDAPLQWPSNHGTNRRNSAKTWWKSTCNQSWDRCEGKKIRFPYCVPLDWSKSSISAYRINAPKGCAFVCFLYLY